MRGYAVDVIDLIDRHPVTGFQIGILILCMLVAALDGFDTQAIGYTAPAIAAMIHLPMPQFGQVGSAGLFGAALGALSFGPLADVLGRKWFMIVAVLVFAIFSYLTSQSSSLNELLAYRFLPVSDSAARRRPFWPWAPNWRRSGCATCSSPSVCVVSDRRPDRLADQRLGHSELRLAVGVLYRRRGADLHRRASLDLAAGIGAFPARPRHPSG
jgi:MFS family permease